MDNSVSFYLGVSKLDRVLAKTENTTRRKLLYLVTFHFLCKIMPKLC